MSTQLNLADLPDLGELFRLFLAGKHLNRQAEPAKWLALEQHADTYTALFAALGFDLRIDVRGFAWFHTTDTYSAIGKTSRQLALLFMVLFDTQASAGKALLRFTDWHITQSLLDELHQKHAELLHAEELDVAALADLLNKAVSLGFAQALPGGWRLLPAVCRYLDHFESLAKIDLSQPGTDLPEVALPAEVEDGEEEGD